MAEEIALAIGKKVGDGPATITYKSLVGDNMELNDDVKGILRNVLNEHVSESLNEIEKIIKEAYKTHVHFPIEKKKIHQVLSVPSYEYTEDHLFESFAICEGTKLNVPVRSAQLKQANSDYFRELMEKNNLDFTLKEEEFVEKLLEKKLSDNENKLLQTFYHHEHFDIDILSIVHKCSFVVFVDGYEGNKNYTAYYFPHEGPIRYLLYYEKKYHALLPIIRGGSRKRRRAKRRKTKNFR